MPKATVSHETHRYDLRTCPGGFVELRQLSYYEMMHRRDIASKMFTEQKVQTGRARQKQSPEETIRAQYEIMNVAIMEFEFKNCIVDHNLEDDSGIKLDFNNPLTFRMLDPKIGEEIGRLIDDLNQEAEDLGPLANALTSSSLDGETKLEAITTDEQ